MKLPSAKALRALFQHLAAVFAYDRRTTAAILGVIFLGPYLVLVLRHRPATYSLSATTEVASIMVHDPLGVTVWLPNAEISSPGEAKSGTAIPHRVLLDVGNGTTIRLAREGMGPLLMQLTWDAGKGPGARLTGASDSGDPTLKSNDVIRVDLGDGTDARSSTQSTVLLGFRGYLHVGEDVGAQVERTLLSGRVTITEGVLENSERYRVDDAMLDPGDEVAWRLHPPRSGDTATAVVSGFVHAGSDPALLVVAHGAADHLEVTRFGAVSYQIRPNPIERILHDPVINVATILLTSLAAMAGLVGVIDWFVGDFQKK